MKIVEMLSFIVFSVFSTLAFAENVGIRFVVDDTSLNLPESQARMVKNLNRMVEFKGFRQKTIGMQQR